MIVFVKDEGNNLTIMAITLQPITNIKSLKLFQIYEGTYFGHLMFKGCWYATNDDKVFIRWNMWMWKMLKMVYKT